MNKLSNFYDMLSELYDTIPDDKEHLKEIRACETLMNYINEELEQVASAWAIPENVLVAMKNEEKNNGVFDITINIKDKGMHQYVYEVVFKLIKNLRTLKHEALFLRFYTKIIRYKIKKINFSWNKISSKIRHGKIANVCAIFVWP